MAVNPSKVFSAALERCCTNNTFKYEIQYLKNQHALEEKSIWSIEAKLKNSGVVLQELILSIMYGSTNSLRPVKSSSSAASKIPFIDMFWSLTLP